MILRLLVPIACLHFAVVLVVQQVGANVPFRRRSAKEPGYPVIFIPGDAGSQLQANLTGKPEVVHYACDKNTQEFFELWLDLRMFVPVWIDCWVDNMKLVYDNSTGTTSNMPGVDVRIPGFGTTDSIEWLDTSKASQGRYFYDIAEAMSSWGYRRGKHMVGAPYDWRKAPNEHTDYFHDLKRLTEQMYRWNGNKKIVYVAHSMGNPTLKYFLDHFVDEMWRAKHIRSFVSIGAPWGGSLQIVKLFASGYNMNYYRVILPPSKLRDMQRSFTSSALLFPNHRAFPNATLASTKTKNYTVNNVQEFFTDINYEMGWEQYKRAGPPILGNIDPPDVETHCIYGWGVQTPERFDWDDGYFPDYPPTMIVGDGDGTVNRASAEVCRQWQQEADRNRAAGNGNSAKITTHDIKGAEHMEIMRSPIMIEVVRKALYDDI